MAQDTPFTVVDATAEQPSQKQEITIDVDESTAFTLKIQEFDKAIAEVEAQASSLKAQKAAYVYTTNLNAVIARSKQPKPAQEPAK